MSISIDFTGIKTSWIQFKWSRIDYDTSSLIILLIWRQILGLRIPCILVASLLPGSKFNFNFKAFHSMGPVYLEDRLSPITIACLIISGKRSTLQVPPFRELHLIGLKKHYFSARVCDSPPNWCELHPYLFTEVPQELALSSGLAVSVNWWDLQIALLLIYFLAFFLLF